MIAAQSVNRITIFAGTSVKLDLFHVCQRFVKTLPKRNSASQQMSKSFGLIFRNNGDLGVDRTMETPSPKEIDGNLQIFLMKWENHLLETSLKAIKNIRKHVLKGCCSKIPPGGGTNQNERLHKYLKRSLLGVANKISPELAIAILTLVFFTWNSKKIQMPKSISQTRDNSNCTN